MIAPLTRSITAAAVKRTTCLEMTKSTDGQRARRPVRGTDGYWCDDAKGGAELCALRAGRYAGRGGDSVESKETGDDGDVADSREMSTKTSLEVVWVDMMVDEEDTIPINKRRRSLTEWLCSSVAHRISG